MKLTLVWFSRLSPFLSFARSFPPPPPPFPHSAIVLFFTYPLPLYELLFVLFFHILGLLFPFFFSPLFVVGSCHVRTKGVI